MVETTGTGAIVRFPTLGEGGIGSDRERERRLFGATGEDCSVWNEPEWLRVAVII